jgi:hypothetical protein
MIRSKARSAVTFAVFGENIAARYPEIQKSNVRGFAEGPNDTY